MKRNHFEKELEILRKHNKDDELIIEDYIDTIYDIIEIFKNQGHSGMSAPFYANVLSDTIKKVLLYEPLSPLYFTDDEWSDVGNNMYQNNRDSAFFKDGKNGKPYYVDAIIWTNQDDNSFTSNKVCDYSSSQFVKNIPFTPKKFYIDVIEKDDGYIIKNENKMLKEVSEYYEIYEQLKKNNPQKYNILMRKDKLNKIKS